MAEMSGLNKKAGGKGREAQGLERFRVVGRVPQPGGLCTGT